MLLVATDKVEFEREEAEMDNGTKLEATAGNAEPEFWMDDALWLEEIAAELLYAASEDIEDDKVPPLV